MTSRQDSTAIGIVASTVSVHKTPGKFKGKVGNGNWSFQYEPVADINFSVDWESSSDEEVS